VPVPDAGLKKEIKAKNDTPRSCGGFYPVEPLAAAPPREQHNFPYFAHTENKKQATFGRYCTIFYDESTCKSD
jgi:hypothetical protein